MKPITEQQALRKLTALCAQGEHCSQEVLEKMRKWGLEETAQARCMEFLTREKYVDDVRYARFFINDKLKYNKWGRKKIEQALWLKGIGGEVSSSLLDEVEEQRYMEVLLPMMREKWKTIRASTDYERSMKLIRWAMGRGYDNDLIKRCATEMALDMEGCDGEDD